MSVSQTNFPLEEASKIVQAAISAGLINLPFLAQCRADHLSKLIEEELPAASDVSSSTLHERTLEAERQILRERAALMHAKAVTMERTRASKGSKSLVRRIRTTLLQCRIWSSSFPTSRPET